MTWTTFLQIVEHELGAESRAKLEARALRDLPGARLTIPKPQTRTPPKPDAIRAALARHHWRVADAAAELGIAPSTIYRILRPTNRPRRADEEHLSL